MRIIEELMLVTNRQYKLLNRHAKITQGRTKTSSQTVQSKTMENYRTFSMGGDYPFS